MKKSKHLSKTGCVICQSINIESFEMYKHRWIFCSECGNASQLPRETYPLEFLVKIWNFPFLSKMLSKLPLANTIKENMHYFGKNLVAEELYDQYLSDGNIDISGTPWEGIPEQIQDLLRKNDISLSSRRVLDISAGPGFVAKEIQKKCEEIVATELSPNTVSRMNTLLDLPTVKFDFNADKLSETFDQKFDLIMMRHSINFCSNIEDFAVELSKITNPGAVVLLSFVSPTLASCLRWQFEDYIYSFLFSKNYVEHVFHKRGFVVASCDIKNGRFFWSGKLFFQPIMLFYLFVNVFKKIDRSLNPKNVTMLFYKTDNTNTSQPNQ